MASRTRLRNRVYALTLLNAMLLIGTVFILTWRARSAEHEFDRILEIQTGAVAPLEELIRFQNAWRNQWNEAAELDPSKLAIRYNSVAQLIERESLRGEGSRELHDEMATLQALVSSAGLDWNKMSEADRTTVRAEVLSRSEQVVDTARAMIDRYESDIRTEKPRLSRGGTNAMWTGLGVAWIIAIVSLLVAKRTLTNVVTPIERLSQAAERLAAGELKVRAPIGGDAEVAQLGTAFNRMADSLVASNAELEKRSLTDELTALPNFRAFLHTMEREIEREDRYPHGFGILILDLDHFKNYNDSFGHLAGNEALQAVGRTLRECVRTSDYPARFGGEEFSIITPETTGSSLSQLAERVRTAIETIPPIGERPPITVSIGGAIFPDDGITPERLFAAADERLYEAKAKGRNRAVVPAAGGVKV
ncbi:MAG: diguanylate cyclase [Thermoanaerobaculia bacterium]